MGTGRRARSALRGSGTAAPGRCGQRDFRSLDVQEHTALTEEIVSEKGRSEAGAEHGTGLGGGT